jgi:hypothetical protein
MVIQQNSSRLAEESASHGREANCVHADVEASKQERGTAILVHNHHFGPDMEMGLGSLF